MGFDVDDLDPSGYVRSRLLLRPKVLEIFGGDPDGISPDNEPPYPHLKLTDTIGGSDRDMVWLIAPELTFELFGDLDGSPGKAALWKILATIMRELRDLPNQEYGPGEHVITAVSFNGARGWLPEPTGQPKYMARVQVFMHPAFEEAPTP